MSEGDGDALREGGNDIDPLAAVVGEVWAKDKDVIPVRGASVPVFGTGEGKTELVSWPGGWIGWTEKS